MRASALKPSLGEHAST